MREFYGPNQRTWLEAIQLKFISLNWFAISGSKKWQFANILAIASPQKYNFYKIIIAHVLVSFLWLLFTWGPFT